jgi:Protein of unknown function (DUF1501)
VNEKQEETQYRRVVENSLPLQQALAATRRQFFGGVGVGLGSMALELLMQQEGGAQQKIAPAKGPLSPKQPMLPAKAKSVIYLHMAGSPSQLELFEYKPELMKYDGKDCPAEFLKGKRFAFIRGVPRMLGHQFAFKQAGQSGQWISELLPELASKADDICVIRSMFTEQFNHAPAQLFIHTGQSRFGYPSMGAWTTYGLGTLNQDLPGFVVLTSGGKVPDAGASVWGSGFLPSVYQGVQCRTDGGDPVLYLSNPGGMDRDLRRKTLDAMADLNRMQNRQIGDDETLTRISQYELAYRMQISVPEVMDISREPESILKLYGARPGYVSNITGQEDPRANYRGDDATFANNCLLARRLVEKGVRFVQLYDWGWDHHGTAPGESIDQGLPIKAKQIDKAIAGLLTDLKQRGLLESTLVVWGGEFGRTPMQQNNVRTDRVKGYIGRDHHPYAFTMWMAGGGIKPGLAFGETDELAYYIAKDKMTIRDLQATVLHQLGLDPFRFAFRYQGLNNRLIGPTDEGRVMKQILV